MAQTPETGINAETHAQFVNEKQKMTKETKGRPVKNKYTHTIHIYII